MNSDDHEVERFAFGEADLKRSFPKPSITPIDATDPIELLAGAQMRRFEEGTVAQRSVVAHPETKWKSREYWLDFEVGLAQGDAALDKIGFEGGCDRAAISTVANLSARFSDETDGGSGAGVRRVYSAIDRLAKRRALAS